jgi:glycine hydroxymethyltransferase
MVEDDLREIGDVIVLALSPGYDDVGREALLDRTRALVERYPLYPQLSTAAV